ncbi:MAG: ABC transporter ATP-binding protein [Bdellovibrionales bacterium]|nr:ABC transporter ATP-binding protein [Bdellovibrionales bacterium]
MNETPPEEILATKNVTITAGEKVLFSGVNFCVGRGERIGIFGSNGTGKTTLLRTICGFIQPASGELSLLGQPLNGYETRALAEHLSYLPQQYETVPELELSAFLRACWINAFQKFDAQSELQLEALLQQVGLLGQRRQRLNRLSGGELRRAYWAALFIRLPDLFILDEPFISVDEDSKCLMITSLEQLLVNHPETSVVLVSHDRTFLSEFCHKVYKVQRGDLVLVREARSPFLDDGDIPEEWIQ